MNDKTISKKVAIRVWDSLSRGSRPLAAAGNSRSVIILVKRGGRGDEAWRPTLLWSELQVDIGVTTTSTTYSKDTSLNNADTVDV